MAAQVRTTTRLAGVLVVVTAAGVGLLTLASVERAATAAWPGGSKLAEALMLVAGWSLVIAALGLARRVGDRASAVLLAAGGMAWFAGDWNNQYVRSSAMFAAGLVFSGAAPALIGHGLLRCGGRRLTRLGRAAVTFGYLASVGLGGLAPALFFVPTAQDCALCASNPLQLWSSPETVSRLGQAAVAAGVLWCVLLAVAVARVVLAADRYRRRLDLPVLGPGLLYLCAVAVVYLHSSGDPYLEVDPTTRALWVCQGCLLVLVAAGTFWPWAARSLTRARLTRLVADVGAVGAGGLGALLGRSLGDPSLRVLYPWAEGGWLDATGRPAVPGVDQELTRVLQDGGSAAALAHRQGLLVAPGLRGTIGEATRLLLDHERLHAQTSAQLADLRASRARLVSSSDAERRKLERDLHDGAQQQLVALSLALQIAALRAAGDQDRVARLTEARAEVTTALSQLRALARGIYPRELAEEGLAAALDSLAEESPTLVRLGDVPRRRLPPEAEAVAYRLVGSLARTCGKTGLDVHATDDGKELTVRVLTEATPGDFGQVEDRVRALGGDVAVDPRGSHGTVITAVIPCAW
jgi:signal transduction histidine kinase